MVSVTEAWLLAGCALSPTVGFGQFLHTIHGHFFAVASPVLPILQRGIGIADWKTNLKTMDGAEFLQQQAIFFRILGGMYI